MKNQLIILTLIFIQTIINQRKEFIKDKQDVLKQILLRENEPKSSSNVYKLQGWKDNKITRSELAKHNKPGDTWIAVNGEVLDVSEFMHDHPGGAQAIMVWAGQDATKNFNAKHQKGTVDTDAPETKIGILVDD